MEKTIVIIIVAALVSIPVMTVVISFCAYVGKVWAIRVLFSKIKKEEDIYGKEKRQKEEI